MRDGEGGPELRVRGAGRRGSVARPRRGGRVPAAPPAFIALAALLLALTVVPLALLLPEISVAALGAQLGAEGLRRAVGASLLSATLATGALALAGVPAGYLLARSGSGLARGARAAILLPTVLPPVAAGVLLLNVVGPAGLVGRLLEGAGWSVVNAFGGVVLAQMFVAAPFVVLTSEAAFRSVDPLLESAAATLGASRTRTFLRVALPLARPGVLAGLALAWMRAVGEFGATVVVAYHPHTLPVYLWLELTGSGLRAALPVTLVALLLAVAALAAAQLLLTRTAAERRRARGAILRGPALVRGVSAARVPAPAPGRPTGPAVEAELRYRIGGFRLDVRLEAGREILSLFGPSGAGKSTVLRLLAGLGRPEEGRIRLDGVTAWEAGAGPGLPPHRRPVGLVFQTDALFPHLTVAENIRFGSSPVTGEAALSELLRITRLEGLEGRLPAELSGGQRQRVALARALIRRPRVLLLDEPFSSLDANMRERLHEDVRRIATAYGLCVIYVTHELRDACSLADRLAVMADGRVLQAGAPLELLRRPASYDVARFVGVRNLVPVRVEAVEAGGPRLLLPGGIRISAGPSAGLAPGDRAWLCARPEDIVLLKPDRPLAPPADENVVGGRIVAERLRGATYTLDFVAGAAAEPGGTESRVTAEAGAASAGGDGTPGRDERLALEIELPVRSYESLGIAEREEWRVSLRRSVLHLVPGPPPST